MIAQRTRVAILAAFTACLAAACSASGPAGTAASLAAGSGPGTSSASASASQTTIVPPATSAPTHAARGAPSPSTPPTAAPSVKESAMPFSLTSSAFEAGAAIPKRYTCDGRDVSPPLTWEGAPDGTASLVLIVDDPDARGFVHWVAFDLTGAATGGLPEGFSSSPDAPPQGTNGFGRVGYGGPCPPSGTHRYVFALYALDRMLALGGAPRADAVRSAMQGHILAETKLTGTYRR